MDSDHFVKNATTPLENVNYMITFDMVRKLNTSKSIVINGIGTLLVRESITNDVTVKSGEDSIEVDVTF